MSDIEDNIENEPEKTTKSKPKKSSKNKKPSGFSFNPSKYVDVKPTMDEAVKNGVAVISFGRMNPVTSGHEKLVNAVISTALKQNGTPLIYLSHTTDKKKNPLTYDQKINFAKKAFGKVIQKSPARTIIDVAKELQTKFTDLIVVVGSDRVTEFETLLNKYNGKDYNYNSIKVLSAGERDPDADDVSGMSASKMRAAAAAEEFDAFKNGLPRKLQSQAKSVYDAVRTGMGLQEEIELDEALTRQQRLKRKMIMRRLKSKILAGRRRAMRRRATFDVFKKRARKLVIRKLKQKFAKSNRYQDLPYSARQRIDDRIARIPKARLDILMKRYLPQVKKAEKDRIANKIAKSNPPPLIKKQALKSPNANKVEHVNLAFEQFLAERNNKQQPEGKLKRALALVENLGGNTNYAIKEIEKIQKGLSRHPVVKQALEESVKTFSEEKYQQYTFEKRMNPQDSDVKDMPGSQPKNYYKGIPKDQKDDRARHFARKSKMDDNNPKAYEPAPGDKEAKTKPSKFTNKFKKMFGEMNLERAMMKRPHMLLAKNGSVIIDKRFKMYRKAKEMDAMMADIQASCQMEELEQIMEAADFIFESNPVEALKKKAEKSGIPYGILKKVYDRGVAAWRTGHRPGTTPSQWGLARVNSFATKSKGTWGKADKDLADKVRG